MPTLADRHDALLLDLDGTVYLGGQVIEHVGSVIEATNARGIRSMYVTNNASRPPAEVAEALTAMGVPAAADDVLTSPEAAATMLQQAHPAGARVLVVGALWLVESVRQAGLAPVELVTDEPVAVVQGHSPTTGWPQLAEACLALRAGADWVACNNDTTLPTDRGLLPGNGSMVAALVAATGLQPRVAGKPERPLLDEAVARAGSSRPLVVGDRLDTDIAGAVKAGMPSLMVLTGVNTAADLLAAPPERRPTHVAFDLRGVLDADRVRSLTDTQEPEPHSWRVTVSDTALELSSADSRTGDDLSDGAALAALAALVRQGWASEVTEVRAADDTAAAALRRCGLAA
ncbi:HAD-IIA family hydrolase [Nakamurella flava]|uniref:HAD-IIA family hydrolase n=1 Tax=Nakamurella flava TaxID=2576308 RepID=A0A4U6Q7V3_9ACTN|nr:HAD-IIA family hydrolase [Nakamurella flava]TKV56178.1 HAD-IIA family hydrolase [Nakamurella flava]